MTEHEPGTVDTESDVAPARRRPMPIAAKIAFIVTALMMLLALILMIAVAVFG